MRKPVNYINNKTLYTAMVEYRTKLLESERLGKSKPQVSRYIGEAILKICNNLAKKGNFSSYTYKGDMISDGIIDCVSAVDNFDPDRYNNPFAYFTQIAWYAFIRRIDKEKRQTYIKHKNFHNLYLSNGVWDESENIHIKSNEYSDEIIKSFENGLTKKTKASIIKGVEKFYR